MAEASVIQTGVDKLVQLVKENKRVSVPDAAKMLNVSKVVVEEWADFLEEEGIISIEYKFTTPYLVDRVLSKKEVEDKVKEFKGKREGFIRKAEVTLCLLDKKGDVFREIKDNFQKLKDDLGHELETVQEELSLLEKYNREKSNIDNEIREQEKTFKEKIHEMESQIGKERQRYREILDDLKKEQKVLDKEKIHALSIRQMVKTMDGSMNRFEKTTDNIKQRLKSEEHLIGNSEEHIRRLKSMAQFARREVQEKRKQMNALLQKSQEQEKKIVKLQNDILKKTVSKRRLLMKEVQMGRSSAQKFKKFFAHNKKIEDYLHKVHTDKEHLQNELNELIKKAQAFNIISKSQDVRSYVSDMQKKYRKIEKDRVVFEREVTNLRKIAKV